jgi:hypothetical protein
MGWEYKPLQYSSRITALGEMGFSLLLRHHHHHHHHHHHRYSLMIINIHASDDLQLAITVMSPTSRAV